MAPGSMRIKTLLLLAAVFAAALVVRLAYVRTAHEDLPWADEREYHVLALEMQHSWAYINAGGEPVVYWPPGYPYFLGAVYRVFGPSISAARAVQAALGALTCILVYLIGARLLRDRRGAVLAAAFAAVYPLTVYTAATLYPTALQTFLLACVIYLCLVAKDLFSARGLSAAAIVAAMGGGAAAACSALVAPSVIPALVCAAAWLAWPARAGQDGVELAGAEGAEAGPHAGRWMESLSSAPETASRGGLSLRVGLVRRLALAILFLVPLAIAVGGWSHRNSKDFGRPIAISANGGFNFWLGNHPDVTATTGNRMTPRMRKELGSVYAKHRNVAVRDRVLFDMGLQYVSSDPGRFVRLTAAKAVNFWRLYPEPMTDVQPAGGKEKWLSLLSYGLLLPFGVVWLARSLARSLGRSDGARLILLVFIAYTLVHAVFISKVRFRVPIDPYILIYAAGAIVAVVDYVMARRGRSVAP